MYVMMPSHTYVSARCTCYILYVFVCSFLGKTTISNDGATIMKLLDVVHPAAKTLVDISLSQDAEVRVLV